MPFNIYFPEQIHVHLHLDMPQLLTLGAQLMDAIQHLTDAITQVIQVATEGFANTSTGLQGLRDTITEELTQLTQAIADAAAGANVDLTPALEKIGELTANLHQGFASMQAGIDAAKNAVQQMVP